MPIDAQTVGACLASLVLGAVLGRMILGARAPEPACDKRAEAVAPDTRDSLGDSDRPVAAGAGAGAGAGTESDERRCTTPSAEATVVAAEGAESSEEEEEDEEFGAEVEAIGPCKMMLVVRTDLKMQKGKIAAQCGHATLGAYKAAMRTHRQFVNAWEAFGQKKVAVKVRSEADMDEVAALARAAGLPHYIVVDAGHTQIAPGSRTVLGIGPAPDAAFKAVTGNLRLL